jgi:hypothetical protein
LAIDDDTTVGEVATVIARILQIAVNFESSFEIFTTRWATALELQNRDYFHNLTGWNSPINWHLITVNTKACGERFWNEVDFQPRDAWVFVDFGDTWGDTFGLSSKIDASRIALRRKLHQRKLTIASTSALFPLPKKLAR